MKCTVLQENLYKAISAISHFAPAKAHIPILSNILLQSQEGKLLCYATDLQAGLQVEVGGKIESDFSITVPAKIFTEFISSIGSGKIILEIQDQSLIIQGEGTKTVIQGVSAKEFPSFPKEKKKICTIAKKIFLPAVQFGGASSGMDETRPIFSSLLFRISQGELIAVSTDGYRLSEKRIALSYEGELADLLIPARLVKEVVRLLDKNLEGNVELALSEDNVLLFSFDEWKSFVRKNEGEYPPYQNIIPDHFVSFVECDADVLQKNLKTAMVFGKEGSGIVKLHLSENKLRMKTSTTTGEHVSDIDVGFSGEDVEIALNGKYLAEFLQLAQGKQCRISILEPLKPAKLEIVDDASFLYVIMPFKV
ncbi:MAG: polymerase III subunit beta protein [Microgenomates group bacterium GW2011_GWF2_45_18]|nr:MAG: polymerase III subunit beta protein [Microgenomates group bacterium GW2011_GWF1_44_10]KKU01878.1 MAG: polymerase III subunit beta protein [Microgenomates group bacterium GW2011_GWF2_45_18]OGJ40672.1 MAG: DNA polymerase III subunit beta [Candidatus Pacebacteria bacterium RIFOXYB1_FULL_44_10]